MTRILAVCSLIAVALGSAVWQHHAADPAHACSLAPFSVHEALGPCILTGALARERFEIRTRGIVEFAGGADER